jgi:hypothetical protein
MKRASLFKNQRRTTLLTPLLALGVCACSEGDAQKSWSALSTCLAGPAAQSALAARVQQLRSIELANSVTLTKKDAWPARCGAPADDLYAALGTSSEGAQLKRKLHERFGCSETKGSCSPPTDASLISVATELWEGASAAGLKNDPAPGVPVPDAAAAPQLSAKSWKSFSDKPQSLVGPVLTPDGRASLLLKPREGRARPRGCEFSAGLSKVSCFDGHADMPELPSQSVDLVSDLSGVYAAGLTDEGLFAYDLKTGKKSDVRGLGALRLVRDGLAVERGDKDQGYQVTLLSAGKAGKPTKLTVTAPVGDPMALGNQVVYLEGTEGGAEFVARSLSGRQLKTVSTEKGAFSGALHGCRRNSALAVAAFASRAGQHNAKPTAGNGKTQVTVTLSPTGGAWSKPSSVAIPFERGIESDLVCTKSGASLGYAQAVDGGVLVGRVDCDEAGCKLSEAKLPGVESKWWWAAGPLGDKMLLMWRAPLGETRLRIAPLAALATTKDVIAFDAPDFGGPNAGELSALYADDSALLVFRGEAPVAVHVGAEGSVRVVAP